MADTKEVYCCQLCWNSTEPPALLWQIASDEFHALYIIPAAFGIPSNPASISALPVLFHLPSATSIRPFHTQILPCVLQSNGLLRPFRRRCRPLSYLFECAMLPECCQHSSSSTVRGQQCASRSYRPSQVCCSRIGLSELHMFRRRHICPKCSLCGRHCFSLRHH